MALLKLQPQALPSVPATATSLMYVDLGALKHNYRLTQQALRAPCRSAAVVKANGYGLGAAPCANAFYSAGCRDFFVALPEEGIALRPSLPQDTPIFILGGLVSNAECARALVSHNLTPVLNDPGQLATWRAHAKSIGKPLKTGIFVDTGMTRNGFSMRELEALHADPHALQGLDLQLILSHLASSDVADDPQNAQQLARLHQALTLLPKATVSFSNSNGIALGEAYHFDLARPGLGLYGYADPYPSLEAIRPAVSLFGRVMQIHDAEAGQTVGYNHTYICQGPRRLATVAIGYFDGNPRSLSNKGILHFGPFEAPIVGRVSMDFTMIDVTDIPETVAHQGAWAALYTTPQSLRTAATAAGTNAYELLVRLGDRATRIYTEEDA